jgi:hypothetical protein
MYSAPPATKIAETTVVIKKARTLLRDLRPLRGLAPLPGLAPPLRGLAPLPGLTSPPCGLALFFRGRTSPPRVLSAPLLGLT